MLKAIETALAELEQLPEDDQATIIGELLETIRSEAKWNKLFADPRSDALMEKMAAKVRADIAAGRVTDGDPSERDAP